MCIHTIYTRSPVYFSHHSANPWHNPGYWLAAKKYFLSRYLEFQYLDTILYSFNISLLVEMNRVVNFKNKTPNMWHIRSWNIALLH